MPNKGGTKFTCTLGPFHLKKVSSRDLVPGHWSFPCAHFCSLVSQQLGSFGSLSLCGSDGARACRVPWPLCTLLSQVPAGSRRGRARGGQGGAVSGSAGSGRGRARTSRARGTGEPRSQRAGGSWRSPRRSCARGSAQQSPHPGPRQRARRRRGSGGRYPRGPGAATVPAAC